MDPVIESPRSTISGDALSYSEINLDRAVAALEREGWLNVYHKIDSPEGLELLKRAELLQLARENGCTLSASAKKADILEALRACPTPWLVALNCNGMR